MLDDAPKHRIGFKLKHNNMTIVIPKPTIECIRETINDGFFKIMMPDDKVREDMIDVFSKKLSNKEYEIVRKEIEK